MDKKNLLIVFFLIIACGSGPDKKEDSFKFNRTKKEKVTSKNDILITPIDIENKGIGPVNDLIFEEKIDQKMVESGALVFKAKCTACHKANKKLIGPAMKGIYERRHPAWVMNMLLNPTEMVKKDPIAKALLNE